MKTNYNGFGTEMIENRPTMNQLDLDEMTRDERKNYLHICDEVARTAFAYVASNNPDNFPAFRSALHELFTFVGTDTRILSLDAYSVRFIPAVVLLKVKKSDEYKKAEKTLRMFKKAIGWACEVSEADPENPESVLFPKVATFDGLEQFYFNAGIQDYYNLIVPFFKSAMTEKHDLRLSTLLEEKARLEKVLEGLAAQPWHYYKDFKDPMMATNGKKKLNHVPASIRKNIEDTMADMLSARELMTADQLDKEEAQIKGGRKQAKQAKAETK